MMKSIQEILPIHAIRVISCGKDWTSDTDSTLPVDKIRGFSFDDWGVHLYSAEKDIHGEYDNVNVPYSNLEAVMFYFNKPQKIPTHGEVELIRCHDCKHAKTDGDAIYCCAFDRWETPLNGFCHYGVKR